MATIASLRTSLTSSAGWKQGISRAWRAARTRVAFAVAGVVTLTLSVAVIPLLRVLPGGKEEREFRAQRMIHVVVRTYLAWLGWMRIVRVRCVDVERLRVPGTLIVANHPTLIDALALMSILPQADCVVKDRYYKSVFLAGCARGAGYILSSDGPALVAECVERLSRGRSVVIFPEGTRSPANALGPFARGAAHIALRAGCDPVPVTIRCEPPILYRDQAWWDVPDRSSWLTLRVGEPLSIKEAVGDPSSPARDARTLTLVLHNYFERQVNGVES